MLAPTPCVVGTTWLSYIVCLNIYVGHGTLIFMLDMIVLPSVMSVQNEDAYGRNAGHLADDIRRTL